MDHRSRISASANKEEYLGEGKLAPLNHASINDKTLRSRIKMATATDNADILTRLRGLVRTQLIKLEGTGTFSSKEAQILHKLAQTYAILDSHTEKEQRKYDFSDRSAAELEEMARAAAVMLEE